MEIRAFTFEPREVDLFVESARELRRDDPGWIPPSTSSVRAQLSDRNPFFRHGRSRNFLALRDGLVVGRCSAMLDPRLVLDGVPVGMVGFFEAERDPATATGLLDRAVAWLKGEGARVVWGPIDFSVFNRYRFKTRGFDREPFLGEPHNPPHYPELFTHYGFEPLEVSASWDLKEEHVLDLRQKMEAGAHAKEVAEAGYRYVPFDMQNPEEGFRTIYEMTMDCFTGHTGYVRVSLEEFALWTGGGEAVLEPAGALTIVGPDDHPAGSSYCYPDWARAMRRLDGDFDPARFRALCEEEPADRIVFHTGMVHPDHRLRGLLQGAYVRTIDALRARGCRAGIGALAKLGNPIFERIYGAGERAREYVVYRLEP